MTINQALQWGITQLKKAGVSSPELDAELLLVQFARIVLKINSAIRANRRIASGGVDRAWLYAHGDDQISKVAWQHFKRLIKRRVQREPVAYILGHKEFYGLDFLVNRDVLIPRPESEMLVEQAIRGIMNQESGSMDTVLVDVGTGSGAIAVALANESGIMNPSNLAGRHESGIRFFAIDNSLAALKMARKNARKHGVADRIKFLRGNLLEPIIHNFAIAQSRNLIIVANLPYGFTSEYKKLQPEITKYEPRVAVDGGEDGLKYYKTLFKQVNQIVMCYVLCVTCFCEIDPRQTISFKKLARKYFPKAKIEVFKDLAGKNRVAKINF